MEEVFPEVKQHLDQAKDHSLMRLDEKCKASIEERYNTVHITSERERDGQHGGAGKSWQMAPSVLSKWVWRKELMETYRRPICVKAGVC